jgi:hypothetical protein
MFKVQGSLVPPWVWTMVFLWKVMFYELRYQLLSLSLSLSLSHTHTFLVYINCTEGFHCDISIYVCNTLQSYLRSQLAHLEHLLLLQFSKQYLTLN